MTLRNNKSSALHDRNGGGFFTVSIVLACVLFVAMTGCSTNATLGGSPTSVGASSSNDQGSNSHTAQQAAAIGEAFTEASVDPQVLFDQEGLKVTLTSIDTAAGVDVALAITVENATEVPVTVFPTFTAVNGYTVYANDAIEAQAGESVDGYFTLVGESLRDMGISDVAQIQLCIGVAAGSAYSMQASDIHNATTTSTQTVFASDPVTIRTSLYDQVERSAADYGEPLWSIDDVRVNRIELVQNHDLGVVALMLWVVNESDEPMLFQYSLAGVNGLSVQGYYSEQIAAGARCKTYVFIDDAMRKANLGDQDVLSIDVTFTVVGFNGQEKAVSDLIHIDLE